MTDAAIVGVYVTEQARSLADRSAMDVTIEAIEGALTDAGLTIADVDGMAVDWPGPGGSYLDPCTNWARVFGRPLAWVAEGLLDCAGPRGLLNAVAAIRSGLCETIVVGGGVAGNARGGYVPPPGGNEFHECWGSLVVGQFALVAQRHMYEYGTKPEHLALVSARIRNHGSANPEAVMFGRGPYTVEEVLASRIVASPLHLLDCCIVNQGGCAMVVTTSERARNVIGKPVSVLGGGMEYVQGAYQYPPLYRDVALLGRDAARRALGVAGLRISDIDVFSLYDATSFEVLRQYEALGLCGQGEGGPFVEGIDMGACGDVPTNLDGGLLSHSWIGTQQETLKVIECVRQLRQSCGDRQVAGAETALATSAGSGAQHIELAVLGA